MSNSRQKILKDLREGLKKSLLPEAVAEAPSLEFPGNAGGLDRFVSEFEKLSGKAFRVRTRHEAFELVIKIFAERGWKQTLIWEILLNRNPLFRQLLDEAGIEVRTGGEIRDLAKVAVGITGAQAALADSGSLVLQNIPGQPSFVSLLPEVHLVLLCADDIHPNLQKYLESIGDLNNQVSASSNLVFITGPSRTGDIELTLTLGVHGPGEVMVIIWEKEQ
jgi:L-lactate dehydrogenase complex protein LldG